MMRHNEVKLLPLSFYIFSFIPFSCLRQSLKLLLLLCNVKETRNFPHDMFKNFFFWKICMRYSNSHLQDFSLYIFFMLYYFQCFFLCVRRGLSLSFMFFSSRNQVPDLQIKFDGKILIYRLHSHFCLFYVHTHKEALKLIFFCCLTIQSIFHHGLRQFPLISLPALKCMYV